MTTHQQNSFSIHRIPDHSLKIRILPPLVIAISFLLTAFIFTFYKNQQQRIDENKQVTTQRLQYLMAEEISNDVAKMSAVLDVLVRSPMLTKALKEQDIATLKTKANPLFERLKKQYEITHFYFHKPNHVTLLRLHSNIRGDLNNRLTIKKAEQTGKPAASLEQGTTGNPILRVVYPWHLDYPIQDHNFLENPSKSPLIGYVELGVELEDIVKRTQRILDLDLIIAVDKKNLDQQKWEERMNKLNRPSNWQQFPQLVITNQTIKTLPPSIIEMLSKPINHNENFQVTNQGKTFQVLLIPLMDVDGKKMGYIVAIKNISSLINSAKQDIVIISFICLFVGTFLVLAFYGLLSTVEQHLAERTERLAEAKDLLQDSNQALQNSLQELQDLQIQLVQREKMSTIGQLIAGIAHEINNPVSFISGNLSYAEESISNLMNILGLYQRQFPNPSAEISQAIEAADLDYLMTDLPRLMVSMKEGTDRISHISTSLRTFSRADTTKKVAFNIHEGIDSTLMILKHRLKANEKRPEISILKNYGNIPLVMCYPGQLNQVFMNLIANAIDALDEYTLERSYAENRNHLCQITISTEVVSSHNSDSVQLSSTSGPIEASAAYGYTPTLMVIRVKDNGPGMPENIKNQIFEHLFTTKGVGKGTGLGLSISRQIVVEKHGGKLSCVSEWGQGAEFVIEIPVA